MVLKVKKYMLTEDAKLVDGRTLADVAEEADRRGTYSIIRDWPFISSLTIPGDYGPGIPAERVKFTADFDDTKGNSVAVYIIIDVIEYTANFVYRGSVVQLTAYNGEKLINDIVDILSRRYKWNKETIRNTSIRLAIRLAGLEVRAITKVDVPAEEVWLAVREPSPEQLFEQVAYHFPAGSDLEWIDE